MRPGTGLHSADRGRSVGRKPLRRRTHGAISLLAGHAAALLLALAFAGISTDARAQDRAATRAPAGAPSTTVVTTPDEPGETLVVEGRVLAADGRTPVAGASVYAYHTDATGSYGPHGNRDPRLRAYLRTDAEGRFRFRTVKPAPYPGGGIPAHIHFHFAPPEGGPERVTEIVFEGEPWVTDRMRRSDTYAVLPLEHSPDGTLRCTYEVRLATAD